MRKYLRNLYLEYMNDFLTEPAFAAYLGQDETRVRRMLSIGRKLAYHTPPKKMVEVKACIAVDVPCYETTKVTVPAELLGNEPELAKYVAEQLQARYDAGDFTGLEPEWESQCNFRLVNLCKEEPAHPLGETMLLADIPIERNYHDFGLEISGQLMRNADAPKWIIDFARHYKLID